MNNLLYNMINDVSDDEEKIENLEKKYITFFIEKSIFTIESTYIREIIPMVPISGSPFVDDSIIGTITLRKSIIPIMDLKKKFYKKYTSVTNKSCIIIIYIDSTYLGLIVDLVHDIYSIPDKLVENVYNKFFDMDDIISSIINFNNNVIMLIDCKNLLENIKIKNIDDSEDFTI